MSPIHYLRKAGEFSTHLAIGSFAIGTLFLVAHLLIPSSSNVLIAGFAYVAIAFFINAIVFFYLLYYFITQTSYREYFAVKMLILLANVPIAAFYLYLMIHFLPTSNF